MMTWTDFYLVCFLVGVGLSVLTFFSVGLHWHIPGGHTLHLHHHGHGGGHGHHGAGEYFNAATITAFLAWFGGAGYLLTVYAGWAVYLALAGALLTGLAGGAFIFWFLTKVLLAREAPLNAEDYRMEGMLGRVISSVGQGGTGEMTYSQGGTRRTCGVRSEDGTAIPRGAEVVVTRYERGLAYVKRWEDAQQEW